MRALLRNGHRVLGIILVVRKHPRRRLEDLCSHLDKLSFIAETYLFDMGIVRGFVALFMRAAAAPNDPRRAGDRSPHR